MINHKIKIIIFCLSSILITPLFSENWKTQLHVSFLFSDNIFESVDDTRADGGARLQFNIKPPLLQYHRRVWFATQYKGGFEGYGNYHEENRWIHFLSSNIGWQINKQIQFSWDGNFRERNFLSSSHRYTIFQQGIGFQINPGMGLSLALKYKSIQLKVRNEPLFTHQGQGGYANLKWRLSRQLALKLTGEFLDLDYKRDAYQQIDTLLFESLNQSQQDQLTRLGFQIEFYLNMLVRLSYLYEENHSNSFGYDYYKPQIHLLVARSLTRGWTATFFFKLSWKNYKEAFAPYWPVSPDTEIEENNLIWLSLSKDVSPDILWKTQWGWYRNESPFRDRYYSKHFILTGFSINF